MLCFVSSFHTRAWGWRGSGPGVRRSPEGFNAMLTDCVPRALVWLQVFPAELPRKLHLRVAVAPSRLLTTGPQRHPGDQGHQTPGLGRGKHPGPTPVRRPDAPVEQVTISPLVHFKKKGSRHPSPCSPHPEVRPPRTQGPTSLGYTALPPCLTR